MITFITAWNNEEQVEMLNEKLKCLEILIDRHIPFTSVDVY